MAKTAHNQNMNIIVFLLGILSVCAFSPFVSRSLGDIVLFIIIGLIILLEINLFPRCSVKKKNTIVLITCYLLLLGIYKVIGISDASMSFHFNIFRFFLIFICMMPLYDMLSKKQIRFLITVCLLTIAVTLFQNFLLKLRYGEGYSQRLYSVKGVKEVVNTYYTSALLMVSGFLFCAFLHEKSKGKKFFWFLGTVVCLLFNFIVTQRGIPLVLSALMFPLLILFNNDDRSRKTYIKVTVFIVIAVIMVIELDDILSWIGAMTGSDRLERRLNLLAVIWDEGGLESAEGSSLAVRFRLMGVSVNTFFSSANCFFAGSGLNTSTNHVVGNHSQLLDEFARYGIFGGLLSLYNLRSMLKITKGSTVGHSVPSIQKQINVLFLIFILRALLGFVYDTAVAGAMFILMPLMFKLMIMKRGNEEC